MLTSNPLVGEITRAKTRAKDTAGLKIAPETREKSHAFVNNERPKAVAMKRRFEVLMISGASGLAPDKLAI